MGNKKLGLIDAWLMPLRKIRMEMKGEWEGLGEEERGRKLVEENVRRGVRGLRENPDVIEGAGERGVRVYGVVFDLGSGLLEEVECGEGEEEGRGRREAFGTKA